MGFAEKLKGLAKRAEDEAATHKDQVHRAVLKAEDAADQRTGGQYHEQILKAGKRTDAFVDGLEAPDRSDSAPARPPSGEPPLDPAR